MDSYRLREILGVFVVVAVFVGTMLLLVSAIIFVQEAILRALRFVKTSVALLESGPVNGTASPKRRMSSMRSQSKPRFGLLR
jgi:hypothetical protein